MSNPADGKEIDDVLSSIRRIVSEEVRGQTVARRATVPRPKPEQRSQLPAEPLLLTAAYMVRPGRTPDADTSVQSHSGDASGSGVVRLVEEGELRDVVSRMVQEELQGQVGERLYANMRRLMRREIAEALALRDKE